MVVMLGLEFWPNSREGFLVAKRRPVVPPQPARKPRSATAGAAPVLAAGSAAGDLLDMEQAIARLKTTRPTFYRWLRAGKLKGMKVGRQWRFYAGDIDGFLKGEEPQIELPADIGPL